MSPDAPSPGAGSPTSGSQQGSSSPAPGSPTSGAGDAQAVELRRKVTDQAEQIKGLESQLAGLQTKLTQYPERDKLMSFLQTGKFESAKATASGPSAKETLAKAFDEMDADAFVSGLQALEAEIESRVSEKFGGSLTDIRKQTVDSVVRTFFSDREAPDQAKSGSEFWNFVAKAANSNTPRGRALNKLFEDDLEAGLEYAWTQFVDEHGDPASEVRKKRKIQERVLASLETGAGLPSTVKPFLGETGGPKRRSMTQIHQLLKDKGVITGVVPRLEE